MARRIEPYPDQAGLRIIPQFVIHERVRLEGKINYKYGLQISTQISSFDRTSAVASSRQG